MWETYFSTVENVFWGYKDVVPRHQPQWILKVSFVLFSKTHTVYNEKVHIKKIEHKWPRVLGKRNFHSARSASLFSGDLKHFQISFILPPPSAVIFFFHSPSYFKSASYARLLKFLRNLIWNVVQSHKSRLIFPIKI